MIKWIIRDYFAGFKREGFKEIMKNTANLFCMWYFGVVLPISWGVHDVMIYFLILQGMTVIMLSGRLHKMILPKQMYLCPMDKDTRREYVVKSAIFRILFPSIINIISVLVLVFMKYCQLIPGLVLSFNGIVLSILMCGMNEKEYKNDSEKYPEIDMSKRGTMECLNVAITLLSSFGMVGMLCSDAPVFWWVKYIFVGIAVMIQLPLTIEYLKFWDKAVEKAVDYESSYRKV